MLKNIYVIAFIKFLMCFLHLAILWTVIDTRGLSQKRDKNVGPVAKDYWKCRELEKT
jgi:hypothetical protein